MSNRPDESGISSRSVESKPAKRVRHDAFLVVSGYLVGIAGFYTNFFPTFLVATAVLVDLLGIAWLFALGRSARLSQAEKVRFSPARTLLSAGACIVLMFAVTWMAFRPPGLEQRPSAEACVYDVKPGFSVPINKEGSITQEFLASADRIHAVSVIIGIDSEIADPNQPHPVNLLVRSYAEGVNETIHVDDIINNKSTRFNFREPIHIKDKNSAFSMQVINKSQEPIGIYIKVPDAVDTIRTRSEGVFIVGHRNQEDGYRFPDHALTGCVAGRAS